MPAAYKCPSCGSTTDLFVEIVEGAHLVQTDGKIEVYLDCSDPRWDNDSPMWCNCGEGLDDGKAKQFMVLA